MSFPNKPRIYKWRGRWYCQSKGHSNYLTILEAGRLTPQLAYQAWHKYHYGYPPSQQK